MLSAVILLLTLTPLGYLPIGPLEVTTMMIPVAIGAMTMGPGAGLFLGGVFGVSSFLTCLGILRASAFGQMLFSIHPLYTAAVCIIPRLLMGVLCGLLFRGLNRKAPNRTWVYAVCSAFSAIANTVLFMGGLALLFRPLLLSMAAEEGQPLLIFILSISLFNCLGEIAVSILIGTPIAKAVCRYRNR
ncbi:MAG: ECF transporter S component [Ruminococcus sp.]|nr:ECF transporter S component [Candidatus Apopatosoma intestinale]